MTKNETNFEWPEPIPGWDLMKWKDETQAAILRETEGMTDEEDEIRTQVVSPGLEPVVPPKSNRKEP